MPTQLRVPQDRRGVLDAAIEHAAHALPTQGPIGTFVHHNTLHAFQSMSFHDALRHASEIFDAHDYLSEEEFRAERAAGRIDDEDLAEALKRARQRRPTPSDLPKELAGDEIRRILILAEIPEVAPEGIPFLVAEQLIDAELFGACRASVPLRPNAPQPGGKECSLSHLDWVRRATHVEPNELVHPVLIPLCAAFLDQGLAAWPMPGREAGFFHAWIALWTETPVLPPDWLADLPATLRSAKREGLDARSFVIGILDRLGVAEQAWESYLRRILRELPGWAGMFRRLEQNPEERRSEARVELVDFLAVRLAYDLRAMCAITRDALGVSGSLLEILAALRHEAKSRARPHDRELLDAFRLLHVATRAGMSASRIGALSKREISTILCEIEDFGPAERRRVWHEAYERHYRVRVLAALLENKKRELPPRTPGFQVAFCIDDRECSIRRHAEELSPAIETFGVAGFFGIPIAFRGIDDHEAVPLCPLGVTPAHDLHEHPHEEDHHFAHARRLRRAFMGRLSHLFHHNSRRASAGALVATLTGPFALATMAFRILFPRASALLRRGAAKRLLPAPRTRLGPPSPAPGVDESHAISTEQAVERVAATLENMGLTRDFAPLIVLMAHGSSSVNNPHRSAYDCGACSGNNGGPNARLFARLANRPEVRAGLRARGIDIPDGRWFIGAVHDTCTDGIEWYDTASIPEPLRARFDELYALMERARALSAHERCRKLESAPRNPTPAAALRHVESRAEDLGQARPELGHATNATCIVGRRRLSEGVFLDRRAFLVSYDPTQDPEGLILERILLAVGPVGAGINLEYYFSRVDNERFGCGTKLPHNLTGLLGVMEGTTSDLRTGLPRQMIEIHEPMRLLVVLEARPELVLQIAARKPAIRELVENGWIQVATIDPETAEAAVYVEGQGFESFVPPSRPMPRATSSMAFYAGKSEMLPPALIGAEQAAQRDIRNAA